MPMRGLTREPCVGADMGNPWAAAVDTSVGHPSLPAEAAARAAGPQQPQRGHLEQHGLDHDERDVALQGAPMIRFDDRHGPADAAPATAYPELAVPDWYRDAKLGIFVHWGLYS